MAKKGKVHPLAYEARGRYRKDLKSGHLAAAEYWRGQAGAFFTRNPLRSTPIRYFDGKPYHYRTWIPYKMTTVAHVRNLRKRGFYARWHPENRGYSVWVRPKAGGNPLDLATFGTALATGAGFAGGALVTKRMLNRKAKLLNPLGENPLRQFCCSICARKGVRACAPKKYLPHGKFEERMRWLRLHYRSQHPTKWPWRNPDLPSTIKMRSLLAKGFQPYISYSSPRLADTVAREQRKRGYYARVVAMPSVGVYEVWIKSK